MSKMESKNLFAGIAREKITPKVGTVLMGYLPRVSDSVHDDLTVTALALEQKELRYLILSITTTVIDDEEHKRINDCISEATSLPSECIMVASIQTHSGPATQTCDGWDDRNIKYCEDILEPSAVKAAKRALSEMQPVQVGIGTVLSDVGVNRREITEDGKVILGQNFWGCYDPNMTVLCFVKENGNRLANIIHYGAHPTSWNATPDISRDWPGIAIDRLEQISGGITMFLNGAVGDIGPRVSDISGGHDQMHEVGERAGYDAVRAFRKIREYRTLDLNMISEEIKIPYKPLPSLEEAHKKKLAAEPNKENRGLDMAEYCYWKRVVNEHENNTVKDKKIRLQNILALGPVVFVPFTGEPFAEIVMRMREYSPFQHTLCLSTTNGSDGYIVTSESLKRGGYELLVAKAFGAYILAENIDDVLIKQNLELLRKLK